MKKLCIFAICVCFTLFTITGCGKKLVKEGLVPVETMKVKKTDLKETLFYVGDVKGQDEVDVYPRTTGKLLEKLIKDGDNVKKDDVIAYVDRDEVGFEFEKVPVTAPIDGIVGRIYLDIGESVSPQIPVAKIVNMDVVEVEIDIVEADLPKLKVEQIAKIKVIAYPEQIFEGKVSMVSPVIDITTRTAPIEIKIPNPEHILKSGMFAKVKIDVLEHKEVPYVLRDSIVKEDSGRYCFIVKDGKACKIKITTGMSENDRIEIIDGIRKGDAVVITGQQGLKDGQPVEIISKGAQE